MIKIYVDGSCKPSNPGPCGFGLIALDGEEKAYYQIRFLGNGTNNIAEISAIKAAAEWLIKTEKADEEVEIFTDSNYCVGLFTKNWNAKKNKTLVAETRSVLSKVSNLKITWVKGHAGNHYNEMADRLANIAVDEQLNEEGLSDDF